MTSLLLFLPQNQTSDFEFPVNRPKHQKLTTGTWRTLEANHNKSKICTVVISWNIPLVNTQNSLILQIPQKLNANKIPSQESKQPAYMYI